MNDLIEERGRPLPPGKHILPSVVALWNRIKGGVDVYSRLLKNCKAVHHCLPPGAAIWLRMLMTTVYNGHQAYLLLRSYDYLMDTAKCNTFQKYMTHKNSHNSFADYCRTVINGLVNRSRNGISINEAIRSDEGSDSDENDEGNQTNDTTGSSITGGRDSDTRRRRSSENSRNSRRSEIMDTSNDDHASKRFCYNQRMAYFTKTRCIEIRTNRSSDHKATKLNGQKCCVWCCQKSHRNLEVRHTRMGYKTTTCCMACGGVALCTVKRIGDKTCFEMWHTATELYDPCSPNTNSPYARGHSNRRAPPSRVTVEGSTNSRRTAPPLVVVANGRRSTRSSVRPNNLLDQLT
jgi:hypothetical protein